MSTPSMPSVPLPLMPTDLPPLSDTSAVQILDFLHELVFRFEAHYGAQIHRFYEDRSFDNLVHPNPHNRPPGDDPPF